MPELSPLVILLMIPVAAVLLFMAYWLVRGIMGFFRTTMFSSRKKKPGQRRTPD